MEEHKDSHDPGAPGISTIAMEAIVSLCLFGFGALVVFDSARLGASWGSDGPESGYFPFYIGLIVCISSAGIFYQNVLAKLRRPRQLFVESQQLRLVLSVLIPATLYVLGIALIGIYVASTLYIAVFMVVLGNYSRFKAVALGIVVCAALFVMFEVWFKVPLYKGYWNPLAFLGY